MTPHEKRWIRAHCGQINAERVPLIVRDVNGGLSAEEQARLAALEEELGRLVRRMGPVAPNPIAPARHSG